MNFAGVSGFGQKIGVYCYSPGWGEMRVQSLGCCPESALFEMEVALIGDDSI